MIYALLSGVLFALSLAKSRSLLAPAPLWNLSWMFLFLVGGLVGDGFYYGAQSVLLLFLLSASFNLVPLLATSKVAGPSESQRRTVRNAITSPTWLLIGTAAVGLAGAVQLSIQLGNSLLSFDSIAAAFDAGKDNAASLYGGGVARSTFGTLSYAVMQFGFAALGARLRMRPGRTVWIPLLINLVAAIAWTAVTTQRSYFLVACLWMVGGYIAAAVASGDERISAKQVGIAMLAVAAAVVFVVGARAIRVAGANAQINSSSWSSARLWAGGYIPTFSAWYDGGGGDVPAPLRLLSGFLSLFGLGGADSDESQNGGFVYIGSGLMSNAGTGMRAVVTAGGGIGAFLIVVLFGALSVALYNGARRARPQAVALYAGTACVILWSINAWHFSNANRVLAQIMICVAIAISVQAVRRNEAKREVVGEQPHAGGRDNTSRSHHRY